MNSLQLSRQDVEVPPGLPLNTERPESFIATENESSVRKGDRELARMFLQMFDMMGDYMAVCFRTPAMAKKARQVWDSDPSRPYRGRIMSFGDAGNKRSLRVSSELGDSAALANKLGDCECLMAVAPRGKDLLVIDELSKEVGDSMCIILLNARLHSLNAKSLDVPKKLKQRMANEFKPVFHLRYVGSEEKKGVLFRGAETNGISPWILNRVRSAPGDQQINQEVLRTMEKPKRAIVEQALEKEGDLGGKFLDLFSR